MKSTITKLFVAASLALAAGCSDPVKDLEKFADTACSCKDEACAKKVVDDFAAWAKKNKDARGDEDRAAKAAEKMATCVIQKGVSPEALTNAMAGLAN